MKCECQKNTIIQPLPSPPTQIRVLAESLVTILGKFGNMSSMNPTEESQKTESLNDAGDVEKVSSAPEAEGETLTTSTVAPRPKPVVWGLVCVGLYTGAMLYGTLSA